MGLFDKIFKKPRDVSAEYWKTLNAYTPVFTSWGGQLYEAEIVRTAIHARATHMSKLRVELQGTAKPKTQHALRLQPNMWQTWGQFLYRLSTILDVQNTAFIVPILSNMEQTEGIYAVLPSRCELVDYMGIPWLRYQFANGTHAAIELDRCGIMTKFQYDDDFFGSANRSLTPTMELINLQNQGIAEAVKAGASYRFVARVTNFTKVEDLAKERQRFNKSSFEGEGGGVLLFPNTYSDIKQIEAKPYVIDDKQMGSINTNVYNHFGVNSDILQNKAFGDAWNAFYEGAIEPFAIQFSEVLSGMLYTENERARGAGVMATANRLQYMSNTDKLNVSSQMADRGIMNRDEIREIWNLPPLPNGEGQAYTIRGEYYLLGQDGNTKTKEGKPDDK